MTHNVGLAIQRLQVDPWGDFNMTKRSQDKSKDCGRTISDLEMYFWGELMNTFQIQNKFKHLCSSRFSWNNGQYGQARKLARLDRFYIPRHNRLGIYQKAYFIHGYLVGSDHSPVYNSTKVFDTCCAIIIKHVFFWESKIYPYNQNFPHTHRIVIFSDCGSQFIFFGNWIS